MSEKVYKFHYCTDGKVCMKNKTLVEYDEENRISVFKCDLCDRRTEEREYNCSKCNRLMSVVPLAYPKRVECRVCGVEDTIAFEPSLKQAAFIKAVLSGKYQHLLYGGAIRGGKTYLAINLVVLFCKLWPGSRWAIVRKDLPSLKNTVLPTFNKIAPLYGEFIGPLNQTSWISKCKNGSEILIWPETAPTDPEYNRWRGLEVSGFLSEEANELRPGTQMKMMERAGTHVIPGIPRDEQPPPFILYTCNPNKSWVKTSFYDRWKNDTLPGGWFYLPAKLVDNPHLSSEYVNNLKHMEDRQYQIFVNGDWEGADEPNQLIKYLWVEKAFERGAEMLARGPVVGEQHLGVDPARFGDDETVLAYRVGDMLMGIEAFSKFDTVEIAQHVEREYVRGKGIKGPNVKVDTIGLGGGVQDFLAYKGIPVTPFIAGASPVEDFEEEHNDFARLRDQQWWRLRNLLKDGKIGLHPDLATNTKLIEDLTAPTYTVVGDKKVQVESKADIKKRIGRSTDYGDAIMQVFSELDTYGWEGTLSYGLF